MQTIGYIVVKHEKILVLVRATKYGRALRVRQSGSDGVYLADESAYLDELPRTVEALKSGMTILI